MLTLLVPTRTPSAQTSEAYSDPGFLTLALSLTGLFAGAWKRGVEAHWARHRGLGGITPL